MEEREMILKELSNIVQYYECIITVLTNHIFQDDKTNLGAINILKQYLERIIHAKRSAKLMYDKALGVSDENDSSEEMLMMILIYPKKRMMMMTLKMKMALLYNYYIYVSCDIM